MVLSHTALNAVYRSLHEYTSDHGINILTFWRRNYFLNSNTSSILNVNNTGTKYVGIMKQTAF